MKKRRLLVLLAVLIGVAGVALTITPLGLRDAAPAAMGPAFRGLTFWLPLLVGFVAFQRLRALGESRRILAEVWGVRLAAVLAALMGVVNVLSALTPALADRMRLLEQLLPLQARHGGHLTAAMAGFALLALARGLWRRKHVAWLLALGVLGLSAVSHLVKGLDYEEALLSGGLLATLWLMRNRFHARSDRPSIQQGLWVLAGALLFTLAYGVVGFYLLDRHFQVHFGVWDALRQTVVMFTQFYDPGLRPVTGFGRYFADSIYVISAGTLGFAGFMLLRPVFVRGPAGPLEHARAQAIVEKHGRSSLARFLLFDDKRYFFTPGGSIIGYAMAGRTAVALGDPVGPIADLASAIQAYSDHCARNDWLPVFYQTPPESLDLYRRAGFASVCIGQEGIVNLDAFTLEGGRGKPLRYAVRKLDSAGYKFRLHQPPIGAELLEELRGVSDEWLTMMRGSEKQFSLGSFDDAYVRSSPIGAVHAPEGRVTAFANLVPEYQLSEVTIDLMRRRKDSEPGAMELLFVSLLQWAKSQGYHTFNLGLSALYGVGAQAGDPALERVLHWIYEHVNQFYNFKGLHSFKEKFHPQWSPRYLVYPGAANLVSAWLAVVTVISGGSLLAAYRRPDWRAAAAPRRG